ncbi:protein male-specific lethal-3 [Trichoplusia ni]|uniref:Protein male-specific lethal-3 n=1 Tax=Trichoplusia ni TaxID=7111 RepID=A0A7E5W5R2_TRINI|nr:protein male-specific lethal-3 [Trichoplusia ni]XP_026735976.1 protein male-specific lethal-3 [Trichoplusia ni]
MVSTRGVRYKFSEGERVLCYEPDPTKAKVLYDSKVLEVIESKDKRGRRTVEYLIHFQGWNSSWDRCVSEDFVLKDTEENRQLQRDLAEKSQLQLGAYLYRRERKKGGSNNAGAGPAKRARHGFSDDGSSSSTQPDEGETGDTDSSSASGSSSQPRSPPPNVHMGRAHITLPSALRDRLTFDYHLVVKRGRLSRLPASPCAAQILESFVKWFARAGAWHPTRARNDPPQKPDMLDVSCRLNLVREVADGLRVYFDFILRGHLLYKQELNQYHEICGHFIDEQEEIKKIKLEKPDEEIEDDQMMTEDCILNTVEEDLKSPKIPEYSHLPPDPMDADKSEGSYTGESNNDEMQASKSDSNDKPAAMSDSNMDELIACERHMDNAATRFGTVARRLRSHKSAVSQSENDEPAPSTSTGEPRTFETMSSSVGSSGSSLSEVWARPAPGSAPAPTTRTPLSLLLDKVAKWQIIPREGTEHLPCRVYGAIHLARLFVKLPDFLNATQMPDFKLKMILKHIDMFVQYLDEHSEWFGEVYYVADSMSRSH